PVIFGEQVASKDVEPWIDLVHADLEAMGYTFGCIPFPSAGVGAPHIRDRTYWVGYSGGSRGTPRVSEPKERQERHPSLVDDRGRRRPSAYDGPEGIGPCGVADLPGLGLDETRTGAPTHGGDGAAGDSRPIGPGEVNGFWRDADWLFC